MAPPPLAIKNRLNRREFLQLSVSGFLASILAACAPKNILPDLTETIAPEELPIKNPTSIQSKPTKIITPEEQDNKTPISKPEKPKTLENLENYNGYRVVGSKVYNSQGEEMIFRGFSRPSLEWDPIGNNMNNPEEAGYQIMKAGGANTVRLSLNQVYWLTNSNYKEKVSEQVKWANDQGLNVILDLHWSGKGELKDAAQQQMPDMHSLDFWKEAAALYKNNPSVLFEIYNEPHDTSPEIWANGGKVKDGYATPGMQKIVDVIRENGSQNIVILNGLNWGFDHQGLSKIEGENIMYGTHPYGQHLGKNTVADFDRAFGFLIGQGQAVIITEFGDTTSCDSQFYSTVTDYAFRNEMSWIAWAWWPDKNTAEPEKSCKFPGIITNWEGDLFPSGKDIFRALTTPVPDGSILK